MKVTFITGNGLDISLGMDTNYSDFYSYIQKNNIHTKNQIYQAITDDPDTWADFELALGAHTNTIEESEEKDRKDVSKEIKEAFYEVLDDLGNYLQEQDELSEPKIRMYLMDKSDFYSGLLGESSRRINNILGNSPIDINFITLNYTSSLERMLFPVRQNLARRGIILKQIHHAHGKLSEYITMGVSNESQISAALEDDIRDDLIKPKLLESMNDDRLTVTRNIIRDSEIIVIYGTSYGATDEYIWKQVIYWLKLATNRYIVLHDYNHEYMINPTRNPSKIKQLDNEARNRLISHAESLDDGEKVNLRSRILVVRNTTKLFID